MLRVRELIKIGKMKFLQLYLEDRTNHEEVTHKSNMPFKIF